MLVRGPRAFTPDRPLGRRVTRRWTDPSRPQSYRRHPDGQDTVKARSRRPFPHYLTARPHLSTHLGIMETSYYLFRL